jgi:hypothetical protein
MTFLKVLAGFLLGAICGAALALALSIAAAEIFSISQMEGAYAMGVVAFYMPLGGLIGGIFGAIWMGVRRKRAS